MDTDLEDSAKLRRRSNREKQIIYVSSFNYVCWVARASLLYRPLVHDAASHVDAMDH